MKMKKLMSAALAGALALSLSVPAFAADTTVGMDGLSEGAIVEVTGKTETATVRILVPATGDIILNPYKLDVDVDGSPVQTQIISSTQYIVNESNLPVKVSTKVTGTIEGADFSATTAVAEKTKKVNLKFGIAATSAKDTEPGSFTEKALAKTETAFDDITMDKKGGANPVIGYKFSGDASENPDTPWTQDDIVGATIAFSFKLEGGSGGSGGTTTTYQISEGTHTGTGTVTIEVGGSQVTEAAANDTVNITLSGAGTVSVTKDSDSSAVTVSGSGTSYSFTMPGEDVTVTAAFS